MLWWIPRQKWYVSLAKCLQGWGMLGGVLKCEIGRGVPHFACIDMKVWNIKLMLQNKTFLTCSPFTKWIALYSYSIPFIANAVTDQMV